MTFKISLQEDELSQILKENVNEQMIEVLSSPKSLPYFRDFLASVYCVESLCFYEEVTKYMSMEEHNQSPVEHKTKRILFRAAKYLVDKYILPNSPFEIDIDTKLRESIGKSIDRPTKSTFNVALAKVLSDINRNLFEKFKDSEFCSEMLKFTRNDQLGIIGKSEREKKYREGEISINTKRDGTQLNFRQFRGNSREANTVVSSLLTTLLELIKVHITSKRCVQNNETSGTKNVLVNLLKFHQQLLIDQTIRYHLPIELDIDLCAGSVSFRKFTLKTSELQKVYISEMEENERLSFFLNLYHLLLLHMTLLHGPPRNKQVYYTTLKYIVGGLQFTLDDIRYGILKNNSKKSKNYFPNNDPRIEFVTKFNPRIQFVISDLSSFSPPIQVFNPTTINKQLKQGAIDLCSEAEFHPISGRSSKKRYQLFLPKHLTPYIKDFGENEHRIIEFLLQYFPKETKSTVLFSLKKNQKIDIVFHSVSQLKNMVKILKNQTQIEHSKFF